MIVNVFGSIFEGKPIPYPKREFLTDEDDDKADTGASKVGLSEKEGQGISKVGLLEKVGQGISKVGL